MAPMRRKFTEEGKAKERQGKRSDITPTLAECKETRQVIGDKAGVGKETVRKVENIKASGSPELVDFVRTGHVSINAAADIATLPKREQTELVAVEKKAILEAAKQIRNAKAIEKREDPS